MTPECYIKRLLLIIFITSKTVMQKKKKKTDNYLKVRDAVSAKPL